MNQISSIYNYFSNNGYWIFAGIYFSPLERFQQPPTPQHLLEGLIMGIAKGALAHFVWDANKERIIPLIKERVVPRIERFFNIDLTSAPDPTPLSPETLAFIERLLPAHERERLRINDEVIRQLELRIEYLNMIQNNNIENKFPGIKFFNEFILAPGQIDEETRTKVMDCDADVIQFVLVRSFYIYIFGPKRNEEIPSFFKEETREFINQFRKTNEDDIKIEPEGLEPLMRSLTSFENFKNFENKSLVNFFIECAYKEMRGSFFLIECWGDAVKEENSEGLVIELPEEQN